MESQSPDLVFNVRDPDIRSRASAHDLYTSAAGPGVVKRAGAVLERVGGRRRVAITIYTRLCVAKRSSRPANCG